MQFVIVNAEPRVSSTAFWATNVENSGESAATTIPQKKRKAITSKAELPKRKIGEKTQHKHERKRASVAIRLGPYRSDSRPPITHAGPPAAMMTKDSSGMFKLKSAYRFPNVVNITGTNAQNV